MSKLICIICENCESKKYYLGNIIWKILFGKYIIWKIFFWEKYYFENIFIENIFFEINIYENIL